MGKFDLSEVEMEIMDFFWSKDDKLTFGEIYNYFTENKNKLWKKQTTQTYLTRLIKKGVLTTEKKGNTNLYFPKITKEEYIQNWTKGFLNNVFDGSVKKFLSALSGNSSLDEATIKELKEFLMK